MALWREKLFAFMARNAQRPTAFFRLPANRVVELGGEVIGKLEGFRFTPDPRAEGIHGRTLRAAALKGLEGEFNARSNRSGP